MPIKLSRRCWLLSAGMASLSLSRANADPPQPGDAPRIAASSLPIPTRSIQLDRETRTVVTAIAADPRGEFVAAAGDDYIIRVLRTSDLGTAFTVRGHRDLIRTLAFDPQGSRLVSAGNDGQLILWNRDQSFRSLQRMQGTPALSCVRFSPDGAEMAAVGFDNEVFIIGPHNRQNPVFQCDCTDLRAVAYRDDNRVLAVAGRSGDLHLFDPVSGRLLSDHALHRGRIHGVTFHRQSNAAVCVAEDGSVSVFDTEHKQLRQRIHVTTGKLFAATILNSQLIAVAGSDNLIRIVNTDDGSVIRNLEGHSGSVSTLTFIDGALFSGSYDTTLRRWSIGEVLSSGQRIAEVESSIERE